MGSGRRGLAMYSSYSYGGSSYGGSSYGGSSYGSSSYGGSSSSRPYSSYGPAQTSRYRDMVSNMYGGLPTPHSGYSTKYTSQYSPSSSSSSYSMYSSRGTTLPPPTRGASIPPPLLDRSARTRTVFRSCEGDESFTRNRHLRLKSPSIPRERTRDELIDSIVHTRTREHRAMPGFKSTPRSTRPTTSSITASMLTTFQRQIYQDISTQRPNSSTKQCAAEALSLSTVSWAGADLQHVWQPT